MASPNLRHHPKLGRLRRDFRGKRTAMQIGVIGLGRMGGNIVRRLARAGHSCVVYDADLDHAAGGRGDRADGAAPRGHVRTRRRARRWRQQLLQGRRAPRAGARAARPPLRRLRHERRRLGLGARLLLDGRRDPTTRLRLLEPALRTLAPRAGRGSAYTGSLGRHGAAGLSPLRPERRGPLREDDPQRHRVRDDAGLRRRLRDPEEREPRRTESRAALRHAARGDRRALASRERGRLLAARPHGDGAPGGSCARALHGPRRRTRAKGRWTVQAAIESATPAHVLTSALFTRFRSRQENPYAEKLLSAMREKFGGHVEAPKK
jgi:hypothetical protein